MVFALLGLGVRQFSVAPRAVAAVKRLVRAVRASAAAEAVREALQMATARETEQLLRRRLRQELADDIVLLESAALLT
jgi:phosphotransferase system enzyme I (PtsI)